MKQLTEQELNIRIKSFLDERLSAHPELTEVQTITTRQSVREAIVSRVKNITKKMQGNRSMSAQTFYQI